MVCMEPCPQDNIGNPMKAKVLINPFLARFIILVRIDKKLMYWCASGWSPISLSITFKTSHEDNNQEMLPIPP